METTNLSKHYTWIDYARFLSIALVVYFHCPPRLPLLPQISLNMWLLPCFFFISGMLFRFEKHPTFMGFAKHRGKQLLIPYFCFFALFYAYWLFLGREMGTEEDMQAALYQPLLEYLYGRPNLVCTPLWFISCLFSMQCIFYLLFRGIKSRITSVLLLSIFPFIPIFFDLSKTPWMLDGVCEAIPFYGIACLFKTKIMQLIESKQRFLWVFLYLTIHVAIVFLLPELENSYLKTFLKIIGSFCIILTTLVLVKMVADLLGKQRFVDYIAGNAIIVLAFHTYAIRVFSLLTLKITHASPDFFEGRYTFKLLMAVLALIVMIVPIYLINRYVPFMIGKGKRDNSAP